MMNMDGMGSMMGWMMGLGLLGWLLIIGLLVVIVVLLWRVVNRLERDAHQDDRTTDKTRESLR